MNKKEQDSFVNRVYALSRGVITLDDLKKDNVVDLAIQRFFKKKKARGGSVGYTERWKTGRKG